MISEELIMAEWRRQATMENESLNSLQVAIFVALTGK
jgi:hypothetical protein